MYVLYLTFKLHLVCTSIIIRDEVDSYFSLNMQLYLPFDTRFKACCFEIVLQDIALVSSPVGRYFRRSSSM